MMDTKAFASTGAELRPLAAEHLEAIIGLMNKEGWYYYDRRELARYMELGQACFSLLQEGRVIGSLFTTAYGNQAWLGNIIVAAEHRNLGLARGMIEAVMDRLGQERGISTFRLGSVPLAIGLYKRAGFRAEAFTSARQADLPITVDPEARDLGPEFSVEPLRAADLAGASALDQRFFKSDRSALLGSLYRDSLEDACLALKKRGRLAGFLMIRSRAASKTRGGFAQGPENVFRLGPCCVEPEIGLEGFKALLAPALEAVNRAAAVLAGQSKIYVVFPQNADREGIYAQTARLAEEMGLDSRLNLDRIFDRHGPIFDRPPSAKMAAQVRYMDRLGFSQEYFEQVMSRAPDQALAEQTLADPAGIFATATPGDKG